jgi:hypothetical protein
LWSRNHSGREADAFRDFARSEASRAVSDLRDEQLGRYAVPPPG